MLKAQCAHLYIGSLWLELLVHFQRKMGSVTLHLQAKNLQQKAKYNHRDQENNPVCS